MYRIAGISGALFAVAVAGHALADPPQFDIVEIGDGTAEYPHVAPRWWNAAGMMSGEFASGGTFNRYHAFFWTPDDGYIDLHLPGPATHSSAMAMNATGQVTGWAAIPPGGDGPYTHRVYRYTPGVGSVDLDIQSMEGPFDDFGAQTHLMRINDHGDVAGNWWASFQRERAYLYTDAVGWRDLSPLIPNNDIGSGRLYDMNNEREVLLAAGYLRPLYIFDIDSATMIPVPDGESDVIPEDMNDAGQFTGHRRVNGVWGAFLYTPGVGFESLDPDNTLPVSVGYFLTEDGRVLGTWNGGAFYWTPSEGLIDLEVDTLGDVLSGGTRVLGVSDDHFIVGTFHTHNYSQVLFAWTPESGPVLFDTLVDFGSDYQLFAIVSVVPDGRILARAVRQSDQRHVAIMLVPRTSDARLTDVSIRFGSHISGDVDSLATSDDSFYRARSQFGFSALEANLLEIVVGAESEVASPSSLDLAIESRIDHPEGLVKVRLKNWASGRFEEVHRYTIGSTETIEEVLGVGATEHVRTDGGDGRIELSLRQSVIAAFSLSGFQTFIDHVQITTK